jgi:hypothetical protein
MNSDGQPRRCGCILHEGIDADHVQGCPVIYTKKLLAQINDMEIEIALLHIQITDVANKFSIKP